MNLIRPMLVAILVLSFNCSMCVACLWDYDTLAMERQRFPDTLELITGKFLRHSQDYYQWRIDDRQSRMDQEPSPETYDDLAVANEKLGNHQRAIELMQEKAGRFPGHYETHANLGTFYIHAGEFEKGIEQIEIAISINPDAHFGREIYQKHLVNYVLSKREDGELVLPLNQSQTSLMQPRGFAGYVLKVQEVADTPEARDEELSRAVKGVLGMMRFGNFDSPILLEALADLLLSRSYPDDAKRLAARALLKASYEVDDRSARDMYHQMASDCLRMQTVHRATTQELSIEQVERELKQELTEAEAWFETIRADEERWIAEGKDLDQEFSLKYYKPPQTSQSISRQILVYGAVAAGILVACIAIFSWTGRRRNAAAVRNDNVTSN